MSPDTAPETPRERGIRKKADASNRYLYFCMVVFVVVLGVPVTQATENSYHNCQATNAHSIKYNKALDALIDTPGIQPATKAVRHKQFADLYDDLHHCTGIWPFQP